MALGRRVSLEQRRVSQAVYGLVFGPLIRASHSSQLWRDPFGRIVKAHVALPLIVADLAETPSISLSKGNGSAFPDSLYLVKGSELNRLNANLLDLPLRSERLAAACLRTGTGDAWSFYPLLKNELFGQANVNVFEAVGNPDKLHVTSIGIHVYILQFVRQSIKRAWPRNGKDILELVNNRLCHMPRMHGARFHRTLARRKAPKQTRLAVVVVEAQ